ncbi:hypothetical protein E2C01_008797 [Portunus trituberculatus]|uniref:Uncharacterized protein n=1 Tax=Portunus trituberculatus TaxID=210409 RepID=A0A5B7D3X8_PORTR|nr:hypothetical protein [Portunus trituberculatus]
MTRSTHNKHKARNTTRSEKHPLWEHEKQQAIQAALHPWLRKKVCGALHSHFTTNGALRMGKKIVGEEPGGGTKESIEGERTCVVG